MATRTPAKKAPAKKAAPRTSTADAAPAKAPAARKAGADDFPIGAVKQDPATKAVAVRADTNLMPKPWAVMTVDNGGHFADHDDVAGWQDLPGTPVPDADA